jgi:hypothetical protein
VPFVVKDLDGAVYAMEEFEETAKLALLLRREDTRCLTPAQIDELARGRVHSETQFVLRLQTVGGFGGKSDQLNAYNVLLGDADYFDRDLARYQQATAPSLTDAVARYLDPGRRITMSVVPRGRADLAIPDSTPVIAS